MAAVEISQLSHSKIQKGDFLANLAKVVFAFQEPVAFAGGFSTGQCVDNDMQRNFFS